MSQLQSVLSVYKQIGETPLEALERARTEQGIRPDVPMTYAGRLDPMAEGLLLILVGDECKNKEKYLGLDKEYEVEVLLGFSTDTGDLLGKIKDQRLKTKEILGGEPSQGQDWKELLQSFVGKFVQEYPMFSSKTVGGKPLFAKAKSGELPDEMPTKEVEIYKIEFLGQREISAGNLLSYIEENILKVQGDFRQDEILVSWHKNLRGTLALKKVIKIRVVCSSGTYMRVLAEKLGEKLGLPALAFSIKRTRVGEHSGVYFTAKLPGSK